VSLPQHIRYRSGGSIHIDLRTRPDAATVRIIDGGDSEKMSSTSASISVVSTALSGAVSTGAVSFNVANGTNMAAGMAYWIQDDPEEALARRIDGNTVYLRRPVVYNHVNAAVVEGTRVTCAINSAIANSLWWDGRAEWNIDGSVYYTAVECTKYPIDRLATVQDLFDIEPALYDMLDDEADIERLLDLGHQEVLKRIAKASPDMRARVFTGSMEFKSATALASLYIFHRRRATEESRQLAETYKLDLATEIDSICVVVPRDADQDGVIEPDERINPRTVKISRA